MKKIFTVGMVKHRHRLLRKVINIQGQVIYGSEELDLVEDVPARCRDVGLADLQRSLSTQNIP